MVKFEGVCAAVFPDILICSCEINQSKIPNQDNH